MRSCRGDFMVMKFGQNSYLTLAYQALEAAAKPLTPKQMLDVARANGFLPSHLYGSTMHKTLSARLAEHIRQESQKSVFFRTAPSTFFTHDLAKLAGTPASHKTVYIGNLRAKKIRQENVLVAPIAKLSEHAYGDYVPFDESSFQQFFRDNCRFIDRAGAEHNCEVKQFVTFTIIYHGQKVLTYKRGKFTTTSELLKGQMSVGFGGHVNDSDFDLFHTGGEAFRANAARELREELFLDEMYNCNIEETDRVKILGYINVDDTFDAQHHIAVLVSFAHKDETLPRKGELSINKISWLDLSTRLNDLSEFDLWSEMIIRNLYSGRISLPKIGSPIAA